MSTDNTEPNPAFDEEKVRADKEAWCKTYLHVWSDLSRGVFDKEQVQKAAEEHWDQSPQSDPIQMAATAFTKVC